MGPAMVAGSGATCHPRARTAATPSSRAAERVADGRLQRPAASVSVQRGAADHVLEAHVPGRDTDMEVGLGGVLVGGPDMEVGVDGVLVSRPTSSVHVPRRRLAAARERGAASGKDRDVVPVGAPPQRRRPAARAVGAAAAAQ